MIKQNDTKIFFCKNYDHKAFRYNKTVSMSVVEHMFTKSCIYYMKTMQQYTNTKVFKQKHTSIVLDFNYFFASIVKTISHDNSITIDVETSKKYSIDILLFIF